MASRNADKTRKSFFSMNKPFTGFVLRLRWFSARIKLYREMFSIDLRNQLLGNFTSGTLLGQYYSIIDRFMSMKVNGCNTDSIFDPHRDLNGCVRSPFIFSIGRVDFTCDRLRDSIQQISAARTRIFGHLLSGAWLSYSRRSWSFKDIRFLYIGHAFRTTSGEGS